MEVADLKALKRRGLKCLSTTIVRLHFEIAHIRPHKYHLDPPHNQTVRNAVVPALRSVKAVFKAEPVNPELFGLYPEPNPLHAEIITAKFSIFLM